MREMGAMCQNFFGKLELKKIFMPYVDACKAMAINHFQDPAAIRKNQILQILGASEDDWQNWRWQQKNRISDSRVLEQILGLSDLERKRIEKVGKVYQWAVTPYYLSLIDRNYAESPIYKQAIPDTQELSAGGCVDSRESSQPSPAPGVTLVHPQRAVLKVTNQCAMLCRHCSNKRRPGQLDKRTAGWDMTKALNYIRKNKEIKEVIIGGGDALLLNDQTLDWILHQLHCMSHVEIKRIKTRVPVTLPQRITPGLCEVLRRYAPVHITTQFNHSRELSPEARKALERLQTAGVVFANQAILLHGVNDNPLALKRLQKMLQQARVELDFIVQPRNIKGIQHFRTSEEDGRQIINCLQASGLSSPTYIRDWNRRQDPNVANGHPGIDI
jgi:KamA family protein